MVEARSETLWLSSCNTFYPPSWPFPFPFLVPLLPCCQSLVSLLCWFPWDESALVFPRNSMPHHPVSAIVSVMHLDRYFFLSLFPFSFLSFFLFFLFFLPSFLSFSLHVDGFRSPEHVLVLFSYRNGLG